MSRILFGGYMGCGNLGDDAILVAFLAALDHLSPGHSYEVFTKSPDAMRSRFNLQGVPRRDKKEVQEAINRCDILLFPGGSIFQDATSVGSSLYYKDLVAKAKKANKKVYLLAQGVGPLSSFFAKKFATDAFNLADFITVRDPASGALLKQLGVKKPFQLSADSAFLLPAPPMEEDESTSFGAAGIKTVGICPRPFGDAKKCAEFYSDLCKSLRSKNISPCLIEMDEEEDGPLIDQIEKTFGGRVSHIKGAKLPSKVQQRMARMEGIISVRLHGAIFAAGVGIPPYILSYDPKSLALASQLGLPTPMAVDKVKPEKVVDSFLEFHARKAHNAKLVAQKVVELKKLALSNVELVARTLATTDTLK